MIPREMQETLTKCGINIENATLCVRRWGFFGVQFSADTNDLETADCNNLYIAVKYPLESHIKKAAKRLNLSIQFEESGRNSPYYKNWYSVFFPVKSLHIVKEFYKVANEYSMEEMLHNQQKERTKASKTAGLNNRLSGIVISCNNDEADTESEDV